METPSERGRLCFASGERNFTDERANREDGLCVRTGPAAAIFWAYRHSLHRTAVQKNISATHQGWAGFFMGKASHTSVF